MRQVVVRCLAMLASAGIVAGCSQHAQSVLPAMSNSHALSIHNAQATPPPITTTHVLTWDALGSCCDTTTVTDAQAAVWLTWVMSSVNDSAGFQAAGIQTMYYTQPNRQAVGGPEYTSDTTTFAHDCNGNLIYDTKINPEEYLMQPSSTHLGQLWQANVQLETVTDGGQFNAIYEDLTDTTIYMNTVPCDFEQTQWSAWSNSLTDYITSIGYPVIYNGLEAFGGTKTAPTVSATIAMNSSTAGGMAEGCYSHTGKFQPVFEPDWSVMEDTEIQMGEADKLFFCRNMDTEGAKTAATGPRIYSYASFLLTYHLKSSVYADSYETPDNFEELPEIELVPTGPVQSVPTDISGLEQTGGSYARQFSDCYLAGNYVGPCAVVVNPNKNTVPWPYPASEYTHTLVVSGQDIYDGGTISTTGPPPPSTMPVLTADIVFP
ncbi:MAG TPA: hypothetical protein VEJ20_04290 [Candidatus Eremiobacteraceae bacterium]|nr:hypothetical protein [Candidatus Eremiobacteraceae bacterium]